MSSEKSLIRSAIIGYGLSAKIFHIPFIQALPKHFALYGIVQRNPMPDNDARLDFPGIQTWTSSSDMVTDPNVDLVVVASTPKDHFDQCKEALEAGKHVLCEKPFTPTYSEATTLAKLAKEKGLVLCIYQNRRWDVDFVTLQSLLKKDAIGRVVEFESHFDRYRPKPPVAGSPAATWKFQPQPGGGGIYDLGTHLLDQIYYIFGMPDRVTAFIVNQRIYTEAGTGGEIGGDSFTVHLHYDKNGILAIAKAAVISPEIQQLRYWVRGEKGSYKKYNLDVQEDQLKAGIRPGYEGYGVESVESNGTLTRVDSSTSAFESSRISPEYPPATYTRLYELLGQAIEGEGQAPVTPEQAADVIKIIELAKQSSNEGRTVKVE